MAKSMPRQQPGTSKQDVRTPKVFLAAVKRRLGIDSFIVDLAASQSNTIAKQFYSERSNALVQSWVFDGWNWLNPPFSDLRPWAQKAFEESRQGAHTAMLVPAGVGANWWRDWVHTKARVLLLNGRITFVGHKQPYPKDCVLLLYEACVIPGYEIWTWPNELQRKEPAGPTDIESAAFNRDLHIEPDSCVLEFKTDEAGASCLAGGLVPGYIRDQAREMLRLADEQKKVPA
jgi:phage N-6-adenine-methyltransferase